MFRFRWGSNDMFRFFWGGGGGVIVCLVSTGE